MDGKKLEPVAVDELAACCRHLQEALQLLGEVRKAKSELDAIAHQIVDIKRETEQLQGLKREVREAREALIRQHALRRAVS